jgi:DNA-directed RNA polymerase subunit RPC12/RpoP
MPTDNAPLSFRCPQCLKPLQAPANLAGTQSRCPHCHSALHVPLRVPTATKGDEYGLRSEPAQQPKPRSPADETYVPVICSLCHTRMLATLDQVGGWLVCPDCGTTTEVPPPPPPKKKIDVMAGAGQGYGLIGYDESRPQATAPNVPLPGMRDEKEPSEREPRLVPRRKRPKLPQSPFLDGTFTFPFTPTVLTRTFVLTLFSLVFSAMLCFVSHTWASTDPVSLIVCMLVIGGTGLLVLIWFVVFSATLKTVLEATATGCDAIESWPGAVFLDWMGDGLWLFAAFAMAMVPGAAVAWLLGRWQIPLMAVSWFFCFPFLLLSMLETNTVFGMISIPIARTFASATAGWIKFYATIGLLLIANAIIDVIAFHLNQFAGIVVISLLQTVPWLIYFRLLGRLAWYCSDRAARADLNDAIDDALDDEEDQSDDDQYRP